MSSTINLTLNNSGGSIDNWTLMDLSFSNLFNSTTTLPADFFVSRISGNCNFTTNNKNHSQGTCITPPGSSEVMNITLSTNLTQTPGSYTGLLNITLTYDNLLNTQLRLANISTRINILNRTTIVAGNQNSSFKLCTGGGTLTSSNTTKNTVNVSITNISVAFSNLNCSTPGACGSVIIGSGNFTYSSNASPSTPILPGANYNRLVAN